MLSLCLFDISAGVGAFVIGLSQISSFFSQQEEHVHMQGYYIPALVILIGILKNRIIKNIALVVISFKNLTFPLVKTFGLKEYVLRIPMYVVEGD